MFVFKAAVVGAGTMGGEIAQVIASAGIPVVLKDVKQEFVDLGLKKAGEVTRAQLGGLVHKQKITQEQADAQAEAILGRITGTTEYDGFGDVDFVIEAVPERMAIKQAVLADLDAVIPGHAIIASNTSALSITEMGEATSRPDKIVGFHFFYPASMMRLVEIVEGADTSPETMQTATTFAQTIRKMPIACGEEPGFVVNRILMSSISEVWRFQESNGLSIKAIDDAVGMARIAPMGPFFLSDLLGLDTVNHVAEHMLASYGDSFYVHSGMQALVAAGELGAKTGGKGFYENGQPRSDGETEFDHDELAQRFVLKAFVEACLVLEEGMATIRDIDLGMMAGAGLIPPPFARADQTGLDNVLAALERAEGEWGERYAPPLILRRLVAQGRLGAKSGQGFFAYKRPDDGFEQGEAVQLETRGATAIAWLDNPPANSLSPQVISELGRIWDHVDADDAIRALVIASANPMLFCAGADIKAFTKMDPEAGIAMLRDAHALLRRMESSSTVTIAAVNAVAFGGGCELAMGCDVRIAAQSASFGQPEINLGIIPGFGGTQRLPRLVGTARALELNLTGDPISGAGAFEIGLVNRVVPDHELLDEALAWARKLGGQAPLAVGAIKRTTAGDA
ncbi:MAG TPA: 3-hydroxyacyl-CoA dehydrogenase NAD-binding domain-containing protein, partial [Solirubrobacteraceae bacterium]|nr:3-hydroxyacyl-CoA dehydrogenase NAD-binding domain-containing protein [Solirubrobacteraceae bacterium]